MLYDELTESLSEFDKEALLSVVRSSLSDGLSPLYIASDGLRPLAKEVFERFRQNDIIFPEFFLMNEAIQAGFELLMPLIKTSAKSQDEVEKVVIGVIEGDIHDIGKNIVKAALEIEGFEVIDLGYDVQLQRFVDAAKESGARIIASSTLMTPTLPAMGDLEELLKKSGLKGHVRTIIGGAATSQEFADRIGADGWAEEAAEGVTKVQQLLREGSQR
jgi:methanogenic corrinoid protein MtbC1